MFQASAWRDIAYGLQSDWIRVWHFGDYAFGKGWGERSGTDLGIASQDSKKLREEDEYICIFWFVNNLLDAGRWELAICHQNNKDEPGRHWYKINDTLIINKYKTLCLESL